jgi:hypothetical protein
MTLTFAPTDAARWLEHAGQRSKEAACSDVSPVTITTPLDRESDAMHLHAACIIARSHHYR